MKRGVVDVASLLDVGSRVALEQLGAGGLDDILWRLPTPCATQEAVQLRAHLGDASVDAIFPFGLELTDQVLLAPKDALPARVKNA